MAQPLKIVIASELTCERYGMRLVLEGGMDRVTVEEITTPAELIQLQINCAFHIVITRMWHHLSPCGKIKQTSLPFGMIAFMDEYKEHYIDRMKSAGAKGFMLSGGKLEELLEAVDTVSNGGEYYCRGIQQKMEEERRSYNSRGTKKIKLTQTEYRVMQLALEGFSDKEIASKLNCSPRTIETHKRNIREKTKTNCNISSINFFKQKGLLVWQGIVVLMQVFDEVGFALAA
ncbi:MAG TPA: response regulator transcription factor [Hanamia sp.]|jgi:DNA-binding NarL/FixJ family response regulator|nr:response regulator transcription factor [Hanamia sp.]